MSKAAFAAEIGATPSYISQLCRDSPPWPGRALQRRIAIVTRGFCMPNDWAGVGEGFAPGDMPEPSPEEVAA